MGVSWHWSSNVWLRILLKLCQGPIVVEVGAEGAVWMRISGHWSSDIRLWVLVQLRQSPVIMQMAGEC